MAVVTITIEDKPGIARLVGGLAARLGVRCQVTREEKASADLQVERVADLAVRSVSQPRCEYGSIESVLDSWCGG